MTLCIAGETRHIIPIGIDCGVALFLRDHRQRHIAYPFDWSVSYLGVSNVVRSTFDGFQPRPTQYPEGPSDAGVHFVHDSFPHDHDKLQRRVERLVEALGGQAGALAFLRKGHSHRHHAEAATLGLTVADDIADAVALSGTLCDRYPSLDFRVHTLLLCSSCYPEPPSSPEHPRVTLHHLVRADNDDGQLTSYLSSLVSSVVV